MQFPQFIYVDSAVGDPGNRNKIVKIPEVLKIISDHPTEEVYASYFRYDESLERHVRSHKSVRGYEGVAYADWFPLDVDRGDDLVAALDGARAIVASLLDEWGVPPDGIRVFFSGKKGFHILLAAPLLAVEPHLALPAAFKFAAQIIAEKGHTLVDLQIYNHLRLFRCSNTFHKESGLFKIPLAVQELMNLTVEDIVRLASGPREWDFTYPSVAEFPPLAAVFREGLQRATEKKSVALNGTAFVIPPNAKPCIMRMLHQGAEEGERNKVLLRLVNQWKKDGYPEYLALTMAGEWNIQRLAGGLAESEIKRTVDSVFKGEYDFGCNDEVLKKYCGSDCKFSKSEGRKDPREADILTLGDLSHRYASMVERYGTGFTTGIPRIDKAIRGIWPGEVMAIVGRTGTGKSAMAMNLLRRGNMLGMFGMFFSLEMPGELVFERASTLASGISGAEIADIFANPQVRGKITAQVMKDFSNVLVVDRNLLTVEDVKQYIHLAENKTGRKVQLVVIDYRGRMASSGGGTLYQIASSVALALKGLAKEVSVALITIEQTNRLAGTGEEAPELTQIRDSGVIEEAADTILMIHRPNIRATLSSPLDEMVVTVSKARKGMSPATERVVFDRRTLEIRPYDVPVRPPDISDPATLGDPVVEEEEKYF